MPLTLPLQQFCQRVAQHPDQLFLHQPQSGRWRELTWAETDRQARCIAQGLLAQGLKPNNRVAILAKNSAEWVIADIAIMMAGMISVPIYPSAGESTIDYVLKHSDCSAVFIGKLDDNSAAVTCTKHMLSIGFPYLDVVSRFSWDEWLNNYEPLGEVNKPSPNDVMTICYTSGSSGTPKGVILCFKAIAVHADAFRKYFSGYTGKRKHRVLSYLPLAHITERTAIAMAVLYGDAEMFYTESINTFFDDLKYTRPTLFISVPRLWAKFQSGVLEQISDRKLQRLLRIPIVKGLVRHKIQRSLGLDKGLVFGCGSAPIGPDTLRWFERIGINIAEAWGMTETCGVTTVNLPFRSDKVGSVGSVMACYEMKLGDNDEVLIRGDAVFDEYYLDPETTAASFEDGWFKTGDKGLVDDEGFWQITGRVKEEFKTAKGKYVAPVPIERILATNTAIEQACVCGSGRKQPVALVVLNTSRSETTERELEETLNTVNDKLEPHQQLDNIFVCKEAWTTENKLLTPTLKLVRDNITDKYQKWFDMEYSDKVVWEEEISRQNNGG